MFLALKEIQKEKLRFTMIILVTALIAYLIYFLSALAFGLAELNKTAVKYWDAEGVIMDESANKNIYASNFNESKLEDLGISSEGAVNLASSSVYLNGNEDADDLIDLVLMGIKTDQGGLAAPVKEGRAIEDANEIMVSGNIRDKVDLEIGDKLKVASNDRVFEIVGFTENSNYNTVPVGYVSLEQASQAMMIYRTGDKSIDETASPTPNMPSRISAVVLHEAVPPEKLEGSGLEFIDTEEFINSIPGYVEQVLTFGLMIVSLAVISAIIIGIFMYIITMQKKPIFGVLKIQGYRNSVIVKSVIYQTLILLAAGFLIGLILTLISIVFLKKSVPLAISPLIYVLVTVFSLLCSLIGSLFSVRTILKIDPLEAI